MSEATDKPLEQANQKLEERLGSPYETVNAYEETLQTSIGNRLTEGEVVIRDSYDSRLCKAVANPFRYHKGNV